MLLRILVIVLGLLSWTAATAQVSDYATGGAGVFGVADQEDRSAEFRLEYRFGNRVFEDEFGPTFRGLGPLIGITASSDGAVYGYGGFYFDFRPAEHWVILPFAAAGGYSDGGSRDLGGVFEFMVGATVAYEFESGGQLGLTFSHISNADIHENNPGVESLLVTYSIPVGNLF